MVFCSAGGRPAGLGRSRVAAGRQQAQLGVSLQWAEALGVFQQAADWIGLESRKSLWGQFWSAHQRFFKYLCVAAKVHRLVELAREELARDKVSWVAAAPGPAGLPDTLPLSSQEPGRGSGLCGYARTPVSVCGWAEPMRTACGTSDAEAQKALALPDQLP